MLNVFMIADSGVVTSRDAVHPKYNALLSAGSKKVIWWTDKEEAVKVVQGLIKSNSGLVVVPVDLTVVPFNKGKKQSNRYECDTAILNMLSCLFSSRWHQGAIDDVIPESFAWLYRNVANDAVIMKSINYYNGRILIEHYNRHKLRPETSLTHTTDVANELGSLLEHLDSSIKGTVNSIKRLNESLT